MKRTYILVVLLGLVLAAVVNGCDKGADAPKPTADATNAVPPAPAPPATN
jgi:hypothetical protein